MTSRSTGLIVQQVWHVTVLGQTPPPALDARLRGILQSGEPTSLPNEPLHALQERRRAANRHGPWVERHHFRPKDR
jgi:hypothetical protein